MSQITRSLRLTKRFGDHRRRIGIRPAIRRSHLFWIGANTLAAANPRTHRKNPALPALDRLPDHL